MLEEKIREQKIVSNPNARELTKKVNYWMTKCWTIRGDMFFGAGKFHQVMVR